MAKKQPNKEILGIKEEDHHANDEFEAMLEDLPKERVFLTDINLYNYQKYWIPESVIKGVVSVQKNFVACDDDIILISCPKSGTTWLKTLAVSIISRSRFALLDSPLLKQNPHDIVQFLEDGFSIENNQSPNNEESSQPPLLSSHIPYELLPHSIKASSCKIVYISRNPMDQFISLWHFAAKSHREDAEPFCLEECFEMFCRGIHVFGPFWNHVLGFWKASLESPEMILFLKYEDMKEDPLMNVKKLAEFIGFPFSEEEERKGVIEEILAFCSIGRMKNLEVSKTGKRPRGMPNSAYFRKGEVGDSKNFLTPNMIHHMEEKYCDHNSVKRSV